MIPRLDISLPEIFLRAFYNPVVYGPKEKLDADVKAFEDFFARHAEKILVEIEKLSGFAWSKDRIPVYLVPESFVSPPYSFTTSGLEEGLPGVVQKIGRPGMRDIHIHIHELAHVNQWQSDFHIFSPKGNTQARTDMRELAADIVTVYVIRNVFGDATELERDFFDFLCNTSEKNKRKYDILMKYVDSWNLNANTLRYYLEQNQDKLSAL